MNRRRFAITLALSCLLILSTGLVATAQTPAGSPTATRLATGLAGGAGSAIGPDGALYVAERDAGRISRVDPQTGAVTTFASGLPRRDPDLPFGGSVDVAFIGATAYVLVTMVGADMPFPYDIGPPAVVGIYRVDSPTKFTVIADLGAFSTTHPPDGRGFVTFIPSGVYYALEPYRGGFLVADGHHNRVLRVTLDGVINEVIGFGNIVPTGLTVKGNTVYMAEAGPIHHDPADGKVVAFETDSPAARTVAAGAPLLVDVEVGPGGQLYALSQGAGDPTAGEGSPALPNTGALVQVNQDGTFTVIMRGLDRPTSLEFIGNTAYIATLGGEVWMIALSAPMPGLPSTGGGGLASPTSVNTALVAVPGLVGAMVLLLLGVLGVRTRRSRRQT
ncbi:MAG: ScyD/ScyE family protein [Chloroflexia bacterium]